MRNRSEFPRLLNTVCLAAATLLCVCFMYSPKSRLFAETPQIERRPVETRAPAGTAYGIYPGVVMSKPDPHMRVQVRVPSLNVNGEWALPCMPVGSSAAPPMGSNVWVMFEQGNIHYPVWMGVMPNN